MKTLTEIERLNKSVEGDKDIQLKNLCKEVDMLRAVLQNKEAENDFLRKQLDTKSAEFDKSAKALIQSENKSLTSQIKKLQDRVDKLLEVNRKLRDEGIEYRKRISDLVAERQSNVESIPEKTREYITYLKQTNEKLDREVDKQKAFLKKAVQRLSFFQQSEVFDENIIE